MSNVGSNAKAKTSGGQLAATEPEAFLLYEGGKVTDELRSELKRVRIGPQVTRIEDGAFVDCMNLVEVQLNEGLQIIGQGTFAECWALRRVTLPSTVTSLGRYAFAGCSSLNKIQFNEGLRVIGERAFRFCTALDTITLPSTVISLDQLAFGDCFNLIEVRLNEGLQKIEDHAFEDCSELASVTIPSTATKLGYRAFDGCINLYDVMFLGGERLLNQEFFVRGICREEQGFLLNRRALDRIIFDEDGDFAFQMPADQSEDINLLGSIRAHGTAVP